MGAQGFIHYAWNLYELMIVFIYDFYTKASVVNPMFTALMPTMFMPPILLIQILVNLLLNKYYAYGNVFLILPQIFTLYQAFWMFFLIWDVPFYLYTLRIWRWINFGLAIAFMLYYASLFAIDYEFLYMIDEWESNQVLFNSLVATLVSYMILDLIPTFLVNFTIVTKEITMNQLAWKREDEEDGFWFKFDVFGWLGVDENIYDYIKTI